VDNQPLVQPIDHPPPPNDGPTDKQRIQEQRLIIAGLAVVVVIMLCGLCLVVGAMGNRNNDRSAAPTGEQIAQVEPEEVQTGQEQLDAVQEDPVDSQTEPQQPAPTDPPPPTSVPQNQPTTPPVGYSPDRAAGQGTAVEVPLYRFVLLNAERPYNAEELHPWNVPDDGNEFIRARVRVTCIVEECDFLPILFDVVGGSGVIYERQLILFEADDMLTATELLEGASIEGELYYQVAESDSDFLLRWEPALGDKVYFDLP